MSAEQPAAPLVLVTGATGYIGGRLVPRLLEEGYRVRCLVREASRLEQRPWRKAVEVVEGDVLQPATLLTALEGVSAAYYLIHSLGGGEGFADRDKEAARNFARAAAQAGVARILYLGGLGDPEAELSEHLESRQATGDALREAGVAVTEFRAAVIVGSGSVSFEMVRYLTERIPILVCPRWVYTLIQPIAIRDVLDYLVRALETPASAGQIIEIGGPDVLTYGQMMMGYARARGLRRVLLPVPVLTPRLSSYWVHLVTPIPSTIAQPLIQGLRNEVIVRDERARHLFPEITPIPYQAAVERALTRLEAGRVETSWTDALASSGRDTHAVITMIQEGMLIEHRQLVSQHSASALYQSYSTLGGERGWLYADWTWEVRGWFDRLIGGVGLRRGRRAPDDLRVGDALDFWRVEAIEPDSLLRLRAEMKVPGSAWLEFRCLPQPDGLTLLTQTAYYAPKGLMGLLYWYLLYPIHALIFSGLIRNVEADAAPGGRTAAR